MIIGADKDGLSAAASTAREQVAAVSPAQKDRLTTLEAWRETVTIKEEQIEALQRRSEVDPNNERVKENLRAAHQWLTEAQRDIANMENSNLSAGMLLAAGGYRKDLGGGWPLDWAVLTTGGRPAGENAVSPDRALERW